MSRSQPGFHAPMEPVHPCREMPTRHCPAEYDGVCGARPCARFESSDPTPWLAEIAAVRHHHTRAQRRARQARTRTRLLKTVVIVWTLWTVVVIVANILDTVL